MALARSLAAGTRLLLLDEPFEGVAPVLSQRLSEVIFGLRGTELSVIIAPVGAQPCGRHARPGIADRTRRQCQPRRTGNGRSPEHGRDR